jgi:hypothetical protein
MAIHIGRREFIALIGGAALLLVGWIGLYQVGMPVWVPWTPRAEQPDTAGADKAKAAAEAEAQRKAEEAEQQRLKEEQERQQRIDRETARHRDPPAHPGEVYAGRSPKGAAEPSTKLEAERRAKLERALRVKAEAEQRAKLEAEQRAKLEAERKANAAADERTETAPASSPTLETAADRAEAERRAKAEADRDRKATAAASAPTIEQLAQSVGEELQMRPAKYNRPDTLFLGASTPVELVIQTAEQQSIEGMLKGFPGEVRETTVRMATGASAYLTGPKDMVEITLRGDPFRTVTAVAPISWIWDVRPLKPGQVQVVLELFSHVRIGADQGSAQIRVLQDTWNLEARGLEWVKYQIAEIEPISAFLFVLIPGAMALSGLALWSVRRLRRSLQTQLRVFISYRRDDASGEAGRIYDQLKTVIAEQHIFIDVESISAGENLQDAIKKAIDSCDFLLAVIGKRWLSATDENGLRRLDKANDYVRMELETAFSSKIQIVPLLVGGASMPEERSLPSTLAGLSLYNALEIRHSRFDDDLRHLIASLVTQRLKGNPRHWWGANFMNRSHKLKGIK